MLKRMHFNKTSQIAAFKDSNLNLLHEVEGNRSL